MIAQLKQFGTVLLLLIITGVPVYSQYTAYSVVKAFGNVYCDRLQKNLQNADKIDSQDKLSFNSALAYLVLLSPKEGRKVVRNAKPNTSSELNSLLMDIVSLEKKHTSSRGSDNGTKQVLALKKLKSQVDIDSLVVLGSGKASFANADLVLNDTARIKALFRSGTAYLETLVSTGTLLDLSMHFVFGDHPVVKIQLTYLSNVNSDFFDSPPEPLGSFVPIYLAQEEALKKEVQIILNTYAGQNQAVLINEVKKYLEDEYGPVLEENLAHWLNETNLLKP